MDSGRDGIGMEMTRILEISVVEYPEDEMDADGGCFGMFWDVSTWNVFLWPSLGCWFKVTDCSI